MIMKLCFITKIISSFKEENASRMHNIMSGTEEKIQQMYYYNYDYYCYYYFTGYPSL